MRSPWAWLGIVATHAIALALTTRAAAQPTPPPPPTQEAPRFAKAPRGFIAHDLANTPAWLWLPASWQLSPGEPQGLVARLDGPSGWVGAVQRLNHANPLAWQPAKREAFMAEAILAFAADRAVTVRRARPHLLRGVPALDLDVTQAGAPGYLRILYFRTYTLLVVIGQTPVDRRAQPADARTVRDAFAPPDDYQP